MTSFAPAFSEGVFRCPSCGVVAQQTWFAAGAAQVIGGQPDDDYMSEYTRYQKILAGNPQAIFNQKRAAEVGLASSERLQGSRITNLTLAQCASCRAFSIWKSYKLLYPTGLARKPHPNLPSECSQDFEEAVAVASISARAGAALLRAAMEKLLLRLTGKDDPNEAIRILVRQGLAEEIQQAMDVVRVTGNKALHGYEIAADAEQAADFEALADLLDEIVEDRIARPARQRALFDRLPDKERDKIGKRDAASRKQE